jgi:hypothetical protein
MWTNFFNFCFRNNISNFVVLSQTDVKCTWSIKKGPALEQYQPMPLMETACFEEVTPCVVDEELSKYFEKILLEASPHSALTKHR